jgi:NADH dehydrogenase
MILVAGATGMLGSEICRRLRARGERVRGLARTTSSAEKVADLEKDGVEIVRGDLKDRGSLDAACAGAEVVISTVSIITTAQAGDSFDATDSAGTMALIDAAKQAAVRQFIFVSFDTAPVPEAPIVTAKRNVEEHLKRSGLDYTILHPGYFMEIWLGPHTFADPVAGTARLYGAGTTPLGYVAVNDVAEVAVRSVRNPDARNATFAFAGDHVSQRDAIGIFEDAFGKPFAVTEIPEGALEAQWNTAKDPFTKTFSALMLSVARGGLPTKECPASVLPDRWESARENIAARARQS